MNERVLSFVGLCENMFQEPSSRIPSVVSLVFIERYPFFSDNTFVTDLDEDILNLQSFVRFTPRMSGREIFKLDVIILFLGTVSM